jgi:alpha-glucosidase
MQWNKSKILKLSIVLNIIFVLIIILLSYKRVQRVIDNRLLKKKIEIVMFGNSITAWGDWDNLLDRNDIRNSGYPGYTSSQLAFVVNKGVLKAKPRLCFMMAGINDLQDGITIHRIQSNYVDIISKLRANGIVPVMESVLYIIDNAEINRNVDSLNAFLIDYCKSNNIDYLDINSKLSTPSGLKAEYSTDGIHLNQKAYRIWANEINLYLQSVHSEQ